MRNYIPFSRNNGLIATIVAVPFVCCQVRTYLEYLPKLSQGQAERINLFSSRCLTLQGKIIKQFFEYIFVRRDLVEQECDV